MTFNRVFVLSVFIYRALALLVDHDDDLRREVTANNEMPEVAAFSANCPVGWVDGNTMGCFKLFPNRHNLSWVQAAGVCERAGGYLAEPDIISKSDLLYGLAALEVKYTGVRSWYLGLTDLGQEGNWKWIHSDRRANFTAWAKHRPVSKQGNILDCTIMTLSKRKKRHYWWEDVPCGSPNMRRAHALCQRDINSNTPTAPTFPPTTTAIETTRTPQLDCPNSYLKYDSSCYKFSARYKKSWESAEANCLAEGGHLASVHNAEEHAFLGRLAAGRQFWLGGRPNGKNSSQWTWSDGSEWDYDKFAKGVGSIGCLYNSWANTWISGSCETKWFSSVCKL